MRHRTASQLLVAVLLGALPPRADPNPITCPTCSVPLKQRCAAPPAGRDAGNPKKVEAPSPPRTVPRRTYAEASEHDLQVATTFESHVTFRRPILGFDTIIQPPQAPGAPLVVTVSRVDNAAETSVFWHIRPGDRVVSIGHTPVGGMSLAQVRGLLTIRRPLRVHFARIVMSWVPECRVGLGSVHFDWSRRFSDPDEHTPPTNMFHWMIAKSMSLETPYAFVVYPNGDTYRGGFDANGAQRGFGIYEFAETGQRYHGEFARNLMHGHGRLETEFGTFEGEMREAYPEGLGVWYYPNGDELDGMFSRGRAHGAGILTPAKTGKPEIGFWVMGERKALPNINKELAPDVHATPEELQHSQAHHHHHHQHHQREQVDKEATRSARKKRIYSRREKTSPPPRSFATSFFSFSNGGLCMLLGVFTTMAVCARELARKAKTPTIPSDAFPFPESLPLLLPAQVPNSPAASPPRRQARRALRRKSPPKSPGEKPNLSTIVEGKTEDNTGGIGGIGGIRSIKGIIGIIGLSSKKTTTALCCSNCGSEGGIQLQLHACAGCSMAWYCSKACQQEHWKEGGHKTQCRKKKQDEGAEQRSSHSEKRGKGVDRAASAEDGEDAPDHLCCPITTEIFTDPVLCSDGETYEKHAILKWIIERQNHISRARETLKISKNDKRSLEIIKSGVRSPMMGGKFESFKLTPNRVVRRLADEWREQNRQYSSGD